MALNVVTDNSALFLFKASAAAVTPATLVLPKNQFKLGCAMLDVTKIQYRYFEKVFQH